MGKSVGLDFEKIEEKYGSSPELTNLVEATETGEITITPYTAAVDRCIERKVKNYFSADDWLPTSTISTVIALILHIRVHKYNLLFFWGIVFFIV